MVRAQHVGAGHTIPDVPGHFPSGVPKKQVLEAVGMMGELVRLRVSAPA